MNKKVEPNRSSLPAFQLPQLSNVRRPLPGQAPAIPRAERTSLPQRQLGY